MKPMSRPLVAVLGASGMIGSAVTSLLARRQVRLRAVGRRPSAVPPSPVAEIEIVCADLTDIDRLAASVRDADAIIHLVSYSAGAATWRVSEDDAMAEQVNVGVMRDLVEVLGSRASVPTVVFAGTTGQAGRVRGERIDGTEPDAPDTTYDRQKLTAENLLKAATRDGVVQGVSLRLPSVFGDGPAGDRGVIATMIRKALAGEPLTMWHNGTVRRDFLFVEDTATAFAAAVDHAEVLGGRHWVLGTGRGEQLGDVFQMIAEIVADHTGEPAVPVVTVDPPEHAMATDFHGFTTDPTAFRALTGWSAQVPLRSAIARVTEAITARRPTRAAFTGGGRSTPAPEGRRSPGGSGGLGERETSLD